MLVLIVPVTVPSPLCDSSTQGSPGRSYGHPPPAGHGSSGRNPPRRPQDRTGGFPRRSYSRICARSLDLLPCFRRRRPRPRLPLAVGRPQDRAILAGRVSGHGSLKTDGDHVLHGDVAGGVELGGETGGLGLAASDLVPRDRPPLPGAV